MGKVPSQGSPEQAQNDPGESNDPKSSLGGFDTHIWTSLNAIFERLGKMDQKIDHLTTEQGKLKTSVEKHDKLILRAVYTVGGAIAVLATLWFIYDHFLKDHVAFK